MLILHMTFRIARCTDTEISLFSDLLHQLICIMETVSIRELHSLRDVSTQSKNILYAKLL